MPISRADVLGFWRCPGLSGKGENVTNLALAEDVPSLSKDLRPNGAFFSIPTFLCSTGSFSPITLSLDQFMLDYFELGVNLVDLFI